ncbi:MAG: sialate O-acetylesterase [Xanthomonadales bacterium]
MTLPGNDRFFPPAGFLAALFAIALLPADGAAAEPALASVFGDHMVLQRERPVRVWGTADSGVTLQVSLAGHAAEARSDENGAWSVILPALPAGGPHRLELSGPGGVARTVDDILVGEVWLCSGQSNMEYPVRHLNEPWRETQDPPANIRLFTVGHDHSTRPLSAFREAQGWTVAEADAVAEFSAACYLFARELQQTLGVPFGLIDASWGGSAIEPWISAEGLAGLDGFDDRLDLLRLYDDDPAATVTRFANGWQDWWHAAGGAAPGPWSDGFDDSDWPLAPATLGNYQDWRDAGTAGHLGMVWYRNDFELSAAQAAGGAVLELGAIDELDVSWLNGIAVGTQFGWGTPREYRVAPGVLRAGRNELAVNVYNSWSAGGLTGPPDAMRLRLADGSTVPLGAGWRYRVVPPALGTPPAAPWESITGLTGLYNAMIAPLRGLALGGALWYQGESNAGRAHDYADLLTALTRDWRAALGRELPFIVIQLPNFGALAKAPHDAGWAQIRDAERRVAEADPLTGLVVTLDSADHTDLHPPNKRIVGRRTAAVARGLLFGGDELVDGIVPLRAERDDSQVVVQFADNGRPLWVAGAAAPAGFELCNATGCRYVTAQLADGQVVLDATAVPNATEVRYAWADAPIVNLFGAEGLPVGSFRMTIPGD